jgi:hypothetical protein
VLLLAWTTADLCDYGVCVHDHEPLAPTVPAGPAGAQAITEGGTPGDQPCTEAGPDDCFCCSHYVDVRFRYEVVPGYTFLTAVVIETPALPDLSAARLYHPPLA